MASTEIDLQNEMPKRPGEFTFTWSIQNYSYCTKLEGKNLVSPDFLVHFLGDAKCALWLYPGGYKCPGFVSCYLGISALAEDCHFTLSIRKFDGQFKEGSELIYDNETIENGYFKIASFQEMENPDGYLVNDTLTIRCRLWKPYPAIKISMKCDVHSKIRVSKLCYTWTFNVITVSSAGYEYNFNQIVDVSRLFGENEGSKIQIIDEGSDKDPLHFAIVMSDLEYGFFRMAVHLIDVNGRIAHSTYCDQVFESTDEGQMKIFPLISKEKLYLNKNVCIPKGQLTLRCEFSYSINDELETLDYRTSNDLKWQPAIIDHDPDLQGVWINKMKQCYDDGKFSDFIIRTPGRQFNVSRTLLSAHSKVFEAMFERNMKEKKSGIVDIEDIDDDTISRMLLYVYTNKLGDIDCASGQKLYFAADKYGITALQKLCSNHLMGCLDVTNACQILELADTHRDQELKSCARDFVHSHAQLIMGSEGWKRLTETNVNLCAETMQWMICNKFLI